MNDYIFHPEALADLDEIWEYIANDSPNAADAVVEQIRNAILSLVMMPAQGHFRSDLTSRPLRFWRVHSYLIAYAPDEHPLFVVAILHGCRSPRRLAAILQGR